MVKSVTKRDLTGFHGCGSPSDDPQAFRGNTRDVTNIAFTSYAATQFQFPGRRRRVITNSYDLLYRRTSVADSGPSNIAEWDFFGPSRWRGSNWATA